MTDAPDAPLGEPMPETPLLELIDLKVHFPVTSGFFARRRVGMVKAVDGVSLKLARGQTLGLVGESGCGKSTLGRAIVGLTPATDGAVVFRGRNLANLTPEEARAERRRVQMIFQDPYASLNPRLTVGAAIAEPVELHGLRQGRGAVADRVAELLALVGLDPAMARRYPHEFSGGQRQRVGIARALACEPDLIVADEAVSALDVSIQAQVIRLLQELQAKLGLTYLFIAHGLGVVKVLSDEVAVMYLGRIVEQAPARDLFSRPRHAYTRALVSAVPVPDPIIERKRRRFLISGDVPSPLAPPPGCRFHTRCPVAETACSAFDATLEGGRHRSACRRADELDGLMPLAG